VPVLSRPRRGPRAQGGGILRPGVAVGYPAFGLAVFFCREGGTVVFGAQKAFFGSRSRRSESRASHFSRGYHIPSYRVGGMAGFGPDGADGWRFRFVWP